MPEASLRAANDEFYLAFCSRKLERMERLWTRGPDDVCVHPGWGPRRGWPAVRESWQQIFAAAPLEFVLSAVVLSFEEQGRVGHVDLIENVRTPAGLVAIVARNTFTRREGRWLLTAHVAAPLPS